MYIGFYVSGHGFGHMTRCLAMIEEILKSTDNSIYLACGKSQNDFASKYLERFKGRIVYSTLNTDVGLVNKKNSLEVDKKSLEVRLHDFIGSWNDLVELELEKLSGLDISLFITDISPVGVMVAKKLQKKVIGISNFTWFNQYEHLGIEKSIVDAFKEVYKNLDLFISYSLNLDTSHMECQTDNAGFICRKIDPDKVKQIKKRHGNCLFISCGKSAELEKIHLKNYNGTVFYTEGIKIDGNAHFIKLPHDTKDTHNYMAACDMAIIKAGWGSIAEALIGHTIPILIERDSVLEDSFMIQKLKKDGLAASIPENQLRELDFSRLQDRLSSINLKKLNSIKNDLESIVSKILHII